MNIGLRIGLHCGFLCIGFFIAAQFTSAALYIIGFCLATSIFFDIWITKSEKTRQKEKLRLKGEYDSQLKVVTDNPGDRQARIKLLDIGREYYKYELGLGKDAAIEAKIQGDIGAVVGFKEKTA